MNNYQDTIDQRLDVLNKFDLNWNVVKLPLFSNLGENVLETNSFGVFRTDTNKWLGTHGKNYTPLQNFDLINTVLTASQDIQDFNLKDVKAGVFLNGRKIYIQLPIQDETIGASKVQRWITALNSHDGSTSIAFGSQQTVIICQNTFYKAYRQLNKVRHNLNMSQKLKSMVEDLNTSLVLDKLMVDVFKSWVDKPITSNQVTAVLNSIVSLDGTEDMTNISTRKDNQIKKINESFETEFATQGENLWGLFNGVTRYTNHNMSPNKSQNAIKESLTFGQGAKINETAFNQIYAFAN
jgi:hypothetical protein